MKKLILLVWLSAFSVNLIKTQDQEQACDPCERAYYYMLRTVQAKPEQFQELYDKSLEYKAECKKQQEQQIKQFVKTKDYQNYVLSFGLGLAVGGVLVKALLSS
ncbi:MAG: hypothetical protein AB7F19_04680 [Candidatus Babeliales bacterium]